ncbi:FlhC family transcriptional regulator [Undibacterium sp. WLX3042]|uniref:FlhC family transcriptional regulator n=1 Tax=Undibacterium sp. WLX3042 TaxID=3412686 RepID=UPI003C3069FB
MERRRTHSSFYLLLYRLAQRSGLEHIHSIIAAYSWYLALAPEDPMSINRLAILVATAQSGSGTVYVSACRSCTANYLLCNTDEKKEFAHSFHCEPCRKKRQLAAA